MVGPPTAGLLDAWEHGLAVASTERPLALLQAGTQACGPEPLAQLTVGERDGRLLDLREWAFGPRITAVAGCPACSAELEFELDVGRLRASAPAAPRADTKVAIDGYVVHVRPPDSVDLRAAARWETVDQVRGELLRRCVVEATRDGQDVEPDTLPPAVVDGIDEALAECDPQADVALTLVCEACRQRWEAILDVGLFLWTEVDQWARRMLVDVAGLASAFGWGEAQVLRLGPARRQAYLELAGR